jgi:DNA-binding CsgD family transcriptional regulator
LTPSRPRSEAITGNQTSAPSALSRDNGPSPRQSSAWELTARELEVLATLESGASVDEIAKRFQVSIGTIKSHLLHIYRKLDVHNRVQAVVAARQLRDEKDHVIA